MPLPSTYRRIAVGKLAIRNIANTPDHAPDFVIEDLISALNDRIARNDIHRYYLTDSRLMWCNRMAEDSHYYHLILEVGNKNVTGVSYLNFNTKVTRDIDKDDNEGSHYSSHILIKMDQDNAGHHLILIENVPGISISSVTSHLNWACRDARYNKEVVDNNNPIPYRPIFEIYGYQSKTIGEALEHGTLKDVELIGRRVNYDDGLDEDPIIEEVAQELRLTVNRNIGRDDAQQFFARLVENIRRHFREDDGAQVFVRIKTGDGQIKRTQVDYDGDEILEQMFVQNEVVSGFDPPLTQRHEAFRQDMIKKMIEVARRVDG